MILIDGKKYIEKNTDELAFGNACRKCDFYGSSCYNRDDFDCHSDSRPDATDVVFVLANKSLHLTAEKRGK